nr:hypothetical protein CFP56_23274 [Quercus suber]
MSGSGNPEIYRPHDVFTAMGRCWVLEDEFSYPINPNLRNSAYVHNIMRQEWAWLFREQQMFYDELIAIDNIIPPTPGGNDTVSDKTDVSVHTVEEEVKDPDAEVIVQLALEGPIAPMVLSVADGPTIANDPVSNAPSS